MQRAQTTALILLVTAFLVYFFYPQEQTSEHEISPNFPWGKALAQYAQVPLVVATSDLPPGEQAALPALRQACQVMDRLFWLQSYGEPEHLLAQAPHEQAKALLQANYGPWERLMDDAPMLPGIGPRPLGGNFYPASLTKAEFEADPNPKKNHPYSLLRRIDGRLTTLDYIHAYQPELAQTANQLTAAAGQVGHPGFARYLRLRAQALQTGDFLASEQAWMALQDNPLDLVIGPIETYEDRFLGIKAAYEGLLLKRDFAWDARLGQLKTLLPALQKGLPVPAAYKAEPVGLDSGLAAFDLIAACGMANAGPKALALNLPNDEAIQMKMGSRRLQFKNVMRAKFDAIMLPLSQELIHPSQRQHVTFQAFFDDTMLHEVGHGLGVKTLVGRRGTVKEALAEWADPMEESKADLLALYLAQELVKTKVMQVNLLDHYVTFTAGMLRSMRFGTGSAHGVASLVRWNYFVRKGAIRRVQGQYQVNPETMAQAVVELTQKTLILQGEGDYNGAKAWMEGEGRLSPDLAADLKRLEQAQIPVDILFVQGG